jgi:hypothetical protein
MDRKCIAVVPTSERNARRRLFDALEEAFPVRFVGRDAHENGGVDAALLLPGSGPHAAAIHEHLPRLTAVAEEGAAQPPAGLGATSEAGGPRLALGTSAPLDRRLRGQRLRDAAAAAAPALSVDGAEVVLAARGEDALWLARPAARGPHDVVAVAPAELGEDETLRDRLRDGRFLALAALVHFLRTLCADAGWRPPPLRACLLFDDPNLHWTSYGYLPYRELVRQADLHDYHVAFATVPLDGWFAHPSTARLFRERADRLSLVVHGNDHTRLELARPFGAAERRALLAQALRRTGAFERRSGVPVDRIMVAPHGVCSQEMAHDLVPLGFEALCISRPYPWLARPPRSWLTRPAGSSPLAAWDPASVVDNGLPVMLRRGFADPDEDLALRAFLDQPLIVYGHHGDMSDGLDRLAEIAGLIGRLGDVQWTSLGDIAASNVTTRQEGDALRVRMFSRRVRVQIPAGVERLVVETPSLEAHAGVDAMTWTSEPADPAAGRQDGLSPAGPSAEPIALPDGTRGVELRLVRSGAPDPAAIRSPATLRWAIARRLMGEGRDRLVPVYRRTTRRAERARG